MRFYNNKSRIKSTSLSSTIQHEHAEKNTLTETYPAGSKVAKNAKCVKPRKKKPQCNASVHGLFVLHVTY